MRSRTGVNRIVRSLAPWVLAASATMPLAGAHGQTLIEAFVSTYNSNPDLLAQRARLRQVDETVNQALAGWRPVIRGQGEIGINKQNSSLRNPREQELRPNNYALSVTQPLFRGGKTVAQTRSAESDVLAERATLTDREQAVLLGTVSSYSDVVRDDATVLLRRNNVRVLQEQLAATNARFRVGELTRTDVAQAESRLARSQSDLTAAEAQAANSRAAYQRVVGARPGPKLQEAPLMNTVPTGEDQAVAIGLEAAPRVIAAKHRIASANYAIDNAIGDLLPTAQVVGTVSRAFDQQVRKDHLYSYSLRGQVTVPLYQNGAEYSRVRQAKQLHGQRQNELDSARRQSAEAVIRAFRLFEAARARVDSISAQVRAAQVALDGVRQEAQVGSRTTLDVLNAEQEFLDAQVQLVSARRDMVVGHYTLISELGQLTARQLRLPVVYYDEEKYYKSVRDSWIGLGSN
ncbi:TolC family outer membrane protein [Reyranella sp. CPCC 100927]|uniref:TolC family outer membrane protein n=1 Tax=Reyranella sp. CPCC 100927 TaxID=2599616 RepID=UPI0011B81F72|nr:TolC family outer membrane protein [Reyranella sp. CPCC 100927]TWT10642.1 TolC family outer membrane protein [Reyranella sp. CPCC 100927]